MQISQALFDSMVLRVANDSDKLGSDVDGNLNVNLILEDFNIDGVTRFDELTTDPDGPALNNNAVFGGGMGVFEEPGALAKVIHAQFAGGDWLMHSTSGSPSATVYGYCLYDANND